MLTNFNYFLGLMMIVSFFIQYIIMSWVMTNDIQNIQHSLSKIYVSSIMAIIMGILEVFMHSVMTVSMSKIPFWYYYIPLFSSLVLFLWLYKNQVGVDDANYLNEMIEHHSMALLTSKEILKKTTNPQVKELAEKIIKTQIAEIQQMKNIENREN
jgi:uncharacterized protein YacL